MKSITELEKRIQCLEKENQYLKHLLADAGISYSVKSTDDSGNEYDPNQGARILPRNITETDAKMFFSMFWGRTDVYSRRTVKKSTGEVNYYTQCYNFWKNGCPRKTGSRIKCRDCQKQSYKELKKEQIIDHLRGYSEDATDVIGVFPLLPDDTCRFIVFDFDNHEKDAEIIFPFPSAFSNRKRYSLLHTFNDISFSKYSYSSSPSHIIHILLPVKI